MSLEYIESERRKLFWKLLKDLGNKEIKSSNKTELSRINKQLEEIYWSGKGKEKYRHYYSDIFKVLAVYESKDNRQILGENLRHIYEAYSPQNEDDHGDLIDVRDCIRKLFDHVSLEIARMDYSDQGDRELTQAKPLAEMRMKITELSSEVETEKRNVEESSKKLEDVKKEYVAILGIFASIVLAFVTGITFTTATIKSLNIGNIYRVLIVVLLVGLVLINMLYALFYYLDRLVHNPTKGSIKPLIISNAVMVILIAGVIGLWHIGFVETHNKNVYAQQYDQIQSSTEKSKEKHK